MSHSRNYAAVVFVVCIWSELQETGKGSKKIYKNKLRALKPKKTGFGKVVDLSAHGFERSFAWRRVQTFPSRGEARGCLVLAYRAKGTSVSTKRWLDEGGCHYYEKARWSFFTICNHALHVALRSLMPQNFAKTKRFFKYWVHLRVALSYLASWISIAFFSTVISFMSSFLVWLYKGRFFWSVNALVLSRPLTPGAFFFFFCSQGSKGIKALQKQNKA